MSPPCRSLAGLLRFPPPFLHALGVLSALRDAPPGCVLPLRTIVARAGVPAGAADKVCRRLTRAGLLVSRRGLGGGYAQARPPKAVTLADVFKALGGPPAWRQRRGPLPARCAHARPCSLHAALRLVGRLLSGALGRTSLAAWAAAHPRGPS